MADMANGSAVDNSSADTENPPTTVSVAVWWVWAIVLVGVLAIFAMRVPLAARFPEPIEAAAHADPSVASE